MIKTTMIIVTTIITTTILITMILPAGEHGSQSMQGHNPTGGRGSKRGVQHAQEWSFPPVLHAFSCVGCMHRSNNISCKLARPGEEAEGPDLHIQAETMTSDHAVHTVEMQLTAWRIQST
jgi:hypothetical protein